MQIIDNSQNKAVGLIIAIMISCFFIFDMTSASSISVIMSILVLFCVLIIQTHGKIPRKIDQFHIRVFTFIVFCFLSSVWAWKSSLSIERGITIFETLICMSVVFWLYQNSMSVDGLLHAIMWSGIIIFLYTISYYGAENFMTMSENMARLGNDFANSNAIGMWMAIVITVYVYYILNSKWKFQNILVIFPVVLMAMSQSRTALIETLIGVAIIIVLQYWGKGDVLKGILSMLFAFSVVVVILYFVSKLDVFEGISKRMLEYLTGTGKVGGSITQRAEYREIGWNQFLRTPLLGIGIGNSYELTALYAAHRTYLHNNFVELLACGGAIGFICYYSIHLYIIKTLMSFRKYEPENTNTNICLAIIVMHLVSDWGTVSYYKKYTYVIFLLCFLHIHIVKRKWREMRYEEENFVCK